MKAITEEELMGWFKEIKKDDTRLLVIGSILISMCKEIDTLTVSKLRPMRDALEEDELLVKVRGEGKLKAARVFEGRFIDHFCDEIDKCTIEGIAPIPIYKPEKE